MVELAVVMPILILIAIGVMDYGRVYFTSIAVANAARAGAEWGAQNLGAFADKDPEIQAFAQADGAEVAPITVTSARVCRCGSTVVTCGTTADCGGGYGPAMEFVEVTASKSVALLIKWPGLPTTINVSRKAVWRAQ
jgi:hypothetical protein